MTAETMGLAVEVDPQLTMPARPRFLTELVTVTIEGGGLLFEGTDEQQVLRGPAVMNLLPKLLPIVDGTRSVEQIAAELPQLPSRAIHNTLALLYTRGLLEDTAADPISLPEHLDAELMAFMRRHVDATRVNHSGLQALHRLARAHAGVCVTGSRALETAAHLMDLLKNGGVGRVSRADFGSDLRDVFLEGTDDGQRMLVVLIDGHEDTAAIEQLDDQCAALGIHWLRAFVDVEALTADLGPFFERGETACYRCFAAANLRNSELTTGRNASQTEEGDRLIARVWADMLASEVIYFLSRIGPMATRGVVTRYNLSTWDAQRLPVCRMPDCTACRGARDGSRVAVAPAALAYEDAVGFPSRHLLDPKSHQVHYHVHSLELAHQAKRYPSAERIPLTVASELPRPERDTLRCVMGPSSGVPTEPLTLARLATLLMFAGGLDQQAKYPGRKLRRWAPTGGNLGSVELYVAARNVADLAPGLYFYQAHEHVLVRISPVMDASEVAEFIDRAAPGDETADALVVFTGAHHRVAQKYASFAYRVVQLDGGVALAQMQTAGNGIGLRVTAGHNWRNDIIQDRLDLIPFSELVTGVAQVKGATAAFGGVQ